MSFINCEEANSQDSIHKPQHFEDKGEGGGGKWDWGRGGGGGRSGESNRRPSAHQPNALPLGQTDPHKLSLNFRLRLLSCSQRPGLTCHDLAVFWILREKDVKQFQPLSHLNRRNQKHDCLLALKIQQNNQMPNLGFLLKPPRMQA